jgi:hypothetical protein
MNGAKYKTAYVLSIIVTVVGAITSAAGLFINGVYRDDVNSVAVFRGNDLVTLVVSIPLLVIGMALARRGSSRGLLTWLAMLVYMLYNYAFYLFGTAFNKWFMAYVILMSLPLFALIYSLPRLDANAVSQSFRASTPVRWVGGFMLLFAIPWGLMGTARTLSYVFTGVLPPDIERIKLVFALDLALMVPFMALGAILLIKRRAWGFTLATIMMLYGAVYSLALFFMSAFAANFILSGNWDALTPLWIFLTIGCTVSSIVLLKKLSGEVIEAAAPVFPAS